MGNIEHEREHFECVLTLFFSLLDSFVHDDNDVDLASLVASPYLSSHIHIHIHSHAL
jgi:hypothetical protein